jgi:flagellar export protein FliJ
VVKTKFDSIVKLKKSKVDELNNELAKLNNQILKAKEELDILENELKSFEYPKNGNFGLISQFKMLQNAKINEINQKKEQIQFLNNQKNILVQRVKEANLEYEKMKYLQAKEIEKIVKKIKQKEAKEMDEIALMLFKGEK